MKIVRPSEMQWNKTGRKLVKKCRVKKKIAKIMMFLILNEQNLMMNAMILSNSP